MAPYEYVQNGISEEKSMNRALRVLHSKARKLRSQTYALYLAYRDPRVPFYAKVFAGLVVAYALSPIDLIPDFIPVIGYLDDLILIPAGIALAIRIIPPPVMADARKRASSAIDNGKTPGRYAAAIIVVTWIVLAAIGVSLVIRIACKRL